ncbi:NAD(P)H-quinone oxidoreductase subunit 2 [Moorella thermoacetica]|uniref:NAD(P)H-quinone oxidoreductase subunit 2 n=1 Tax=Neomoorella thermoacetica TaxID=1525 RepID=A0A1D7XE46_NEOTH|nr:hydrogenase 4 subunit D [Moorella thermoacetica]AOQ25170.1 Na(+)/H(+) antiporter subunit A1 [Moorella thermoacetica]OIQ09156.1 Na(+)/H(+) antiporter subunit A1 [Moorella thermoacetica]TYL15299.1 NAD(P)H-quinone oxidoreductase subunit 2 [Moorella thermoacetica]
MVEYAVASILIPILGSVLAVIMPGSYVKRISPLFAFLTFASNLLLMIDFSRAGGASITQGLLQFGGMQVLGVTIDKVSVLIGFAVIFMGLLVCVYSLGYMTTSNKEHPVHGGTKRYYAFLLLFIGSMAGLVFSSTIIGLLVFFELTGVCSWGLIGFYDTPAARRAALKALIITHVASIGLYVAAIYLFINSGSFELAALAGLKDTAKVVVFLGILVASWGKSAQLPLHSWLPDAMVAPTPVSAYLHAASMVKVGAYIFARTLLSAGSVPQVIGYIGGIMAIVTLAYGFAMYFPQQDMKKLLAYSTIAQLSYIFLALSISVFGSSMAYKGAVAHIFNHAFAKGLFFLVAGALSYTTGTRMLPQLRGILSKMPLVGVSFAAAALAVGGTPPFNLFFSKFSIFVGGFEAAKNHPIVLLLVLVAVVESVGSFAWLLRWFGTCVMGKPSETVAGAITLPLSMKIVLLLLVVMTLISQYIALVFLG